LGVVWCDGEGARSEERENERPERESGREELRKKRRRKRRTPHDIAARKREDQRAAPDSVPRFAR